MSTRLNNESYYESPSGDKKQELLELLRDYMVKHNNMNPTLNDLRDDPLMPEQTGKNIYSTYFGDLPKAVFKAQRMIPKNDTDEKLEKDLMDKVLDACFQHGNDHSWISEASLIKIGIAMKDVNRFYGNIKKFKEAVKDRLWAQKHNRNKKRDKPFSQPRENDSQRLASTVTVPTAVLKSVAEAREETKDPEPTVKVGELGCVESNPPKLAAKEFAEKIAEKVIERTAEESPEYTQGTDSADDYYLIDEEHEHSESSSEQPFGTETVAIDVVAETKSENTSDVEVEPEVEVKVESEPKLESESASELKTEAESEIDFGEDCCENYRKICLAKGYIIAQTELRELRKNGYGSILPFWEKLIKKFGPCYDWDTIIGVPFKTEKQTAYMKAMKEKAMKPVEPEKDETSIDVTADVKEDSLDEKATDVKEETSIETTVDAEEDEKVTKEDADKEETVMEEPKVENVEKEVEQPEVVVSGSNIVVNVEMEQRKFNICIDATLPKNGHGTFTVPVTITY